jgi:CYTH domain-containing protein
MQQPHKYGRIERERRFLLGAFPSGDVVRIRHIKDRYLDGTRLRLREQADEGGPAIFKLTQKVADGESGALHELVTNIYLTADEFQLLSRLPGRMLSKVRYSIPPFGIDVFADALEGLRLAEAEFRSAADADALAIPGYMLHEVTGDVRFTGGQLVRASRQSVEDWLTGYGMTL